MAWPNTKTGWVDGVTELEAAWFNATEDYIGCPGSDDPASLTYKLTNQASVSPGHKHVVAELSDGDDADVLWRDPADHTWKHVTPDAAGLVAKTGDQTIGGVKTFSSIPLGPNSNPTQGNELTRKAYIDGLMSSEAAARDAAITSAVAAEASARAAADDALNTAMGLRLPTATYTSTGSIDPGHKHSKLWLPDGSVEAVQVAATTGNVGVGGSPSTEKMEVAGKVSAYGFKYRIQTFADGALITPDCDGYQRGTQTNTQAASTLTVNNPTGTPVDFQKYELRIKSTNAHTFSWGGGYASTTDVTLPASIGVGKEVLFGFEYNAADSKWQLIALNNIV